VSAELVSGNYFTALGVKPALGRVFSSREDDRVYKGHPAVVLSHQYWVTRFAADPKVIGQKIQVNNYPMVIVGVSAAGFTGLDPSQSPQLRVPVQMKALMTPGWDDMGNRRSQWIQMFARMKAGVHGGFGEGAAAGAVLAGPAGTSWRLSFPLRQHRNCSTCEKQRLQRRLRRSRRVLRLHAREHLYPLAAPVPHVRPNPASSTPSSGPARATAAIARGPGP